LEKKYFTRQKKIFDVKGPKDKIDSDELRGKTGFTIQRRASHSRVAVSVTILWDILSIGESSNK
jgi:hypothetical protein